MIMDDYSRFRYVIIESEQVADEYKGDRIAVPMNHFQYPGGEERYMVLDATLAQVSEAPSFEAGSIRICPCGAGSQSSLPTGCPKTRKTRGHQRTGMMCRRRNPKA